MIGPMSLNTAQPAIGTVSFSPLSFAHIPSEPFLYPFFWSSSAPLVGLNSLVSFFARMSFTESKYGRIAGVFGYGSGEREPAPRYPTETTLSRSMKLLRAQRTSLLSNGGLV